MGYKYDRASFLEEAGRLVVEEGLSRLTFGRLAARLGVPGPGRRLLLPHQSDLISETMHTLGTGLQVLIEEAFGSTRRSPEDVVADAVRVLTAPESDRIVRVFLEIVGHAALRPQAIPAIAAGVVTAWVKWLGAVARGRRRPARCRPRRGGASRWAAHRPPPPRARRRARRSLRSLTAGWVVG
ncbi:MAG: hypothetical protein IPH03_02115 [Tetrasphaera sp.]|nr:hypothetical protein [Tetrasphaera sp.]